MELTIKKAIIHVLDREAEVPLLNEFELEISEDIYTFLEKHITKSLTDDEARKARFRQGRNIIKEVCANIAVDEAYFVDGSKDIGRQLFKAMKTNSSISSTDLIVCLFEDGGERKVAILKMDYNTSFIHDIEVVDEKFKISIKKQEISLPGPGQKIQKCAFVNCTNTQPEYDLVILDNQINTKNAEEPVAQFFLQTFLGAELVVDSKVCTKIFKKETENWIRAKAKEGEAAVEEIREFVHNAIREQDEIDLNTFSYEAFGNKQDLREDFVRNMKEKGLAEARFEVDREWVDRKLNKIKLKTQHGIEISMNYEDFNNREIFEMINNADGTRSIVIKNVVNIFEK